MVLDFISPESVGESIQLTDEVRLLPENHIAKEKTLEVKFSTIIIRNTYIIHYIKAWLYLSLFSLQVKKRALDTIDAAIKKVRELTNALQESSPLIV